MSPRVRLPLVAFLLGALASCSGCSSRASPCALAEVCASDGRCGTSTFRTGDAPYRCYVRDEDDCEQSRACREDGRCRFDPALVNECVATLPPPEDAHVACRASPLCREHGFCDGFEGACAPTTQAHCSASLACALYGQCPFDEERHSCRVESPADCAHSLECRATAIARCDFEEVPIAGVKRCMRAGEPDAGYERTRCMRQPACDAEGRCLRALDGNCVTSREAGGPDWRPAPRASCDDHEECDDADAVSRRSQRPTRRRHR